MRDFKELKVWQKSHQLAVAVYRMTSAFPKEEMYGITSQIRRSCTSIPANISEGCGRETNKDFARFLQISIGSANELEYYFILCHDIGLLQSNDYNELIQELNKVRKMLIAFVQKLKSNDTQ